MKIATLWLVVRPSGLTPLEHGIKGSNISTFTCDNLYPPEKRVLMYILLIMILKTFMVEARNGTRTVSQTKRDWIDGRELSAGYPVQAVIQLVEIGNIQLHQETKAHIGLKRQEKVDEMMVDALRWSDKRKPWYHNVRHSVGSTQIDKPEHEVSDVGSAVFTCLVVIPMIDSLLFLTQGNNVVAHSKKRPKGTRTIVSNAKTLYSPHQKKPTANSLYARMRSTLFLLLPNGK